MWVKGPVAATSRRLGRQNAEIMGVHDPRADESRGDDRVDEPALRLPGLWRKTEQEAAVRRAAHAIRHSRSAASGGVNFKLRAAATAR